MLEEPAPVELHFAKGTNIGVVHKKLPTVEWICITEGEMFSCGKDPTLE